jgi:hypothetical protein
MHPGVKNSKKKKVITPIPENMRNGAKRSSTVLPQIDNRNSFPAPSAQLKCRTAKKRK